MQIFYHFFSHSASAMHQSLQVKISPIQIHCSLLPQRFSALGDVTDPWQCGKIGKLVRKRQQFKNYCVQINLWHLKTVATCQLIFCAYFVFKWPELTTEVVIYTWSLASNKFDLFDEMVAGFHYNNIYAFQYDDRYYGEIELIRNPAKPSSQDNLWGIACFLNFYLLMPLGSFQWSIRNSRFVDKKSSFEGDFPLLTHGLVCSGFYTWGIKNPLSGWF